jgi:hypothetical protein
MKILERYDQTKQVVAWGEVWTVPTWVLWVAIDHAGKIYGFSDQPIPSLGWWGNTRESTNTLAHVEYNGDWRESLVYVGDQS